MSSGKSAIRQRLEHALQGKWIERPVYAVYDWFVKNRSIDWHSLFDQGLGEINHANLVQQEQPHLQIIETNTEREGQVCRDVRWITDRGELHELYRGEWRQEYLVKSPEDYRILGRAFSDVKVKAIPEVFDQSENSLGDGGITLGQLGRTPVQQIQIDFAGLERFSLDLAEGLPELMELIERMNELKLKEFQVATQTPAVYIKLWENLTVETMGQQVFRQLLVPFYQRIGEILKGSGQRLLVHYDGKLRLIAEDINALPFHGLDSLTPPPEGDLTIAEARGWWPEKFLWLHPPLGWFRLPWEELKRNIQKMIRDAGPRNYCLLLSEEVPSNWQWYIPAVLRILNTE